jgi:hypothetical protein
MPILKMELECINCGWTFSAMNRIAMIQKAVHEERFHHKVNYSNITHCICGTKIRLEMFANRCQCGMIYDLFGRSSGIGYEWDKVKDHLPEIFIENSMD